MNNNSDSDKKSKVRITLSNNFFRHQMEWATDTLINKWASPRIKQMMEHDRFVTRDVRLSLSWYYGEDTFKWSYDKCIQKMEEFGTINVTRIRNKKQSAIGIMYLNNDR